MEMVTTAPDWDLLKTQKETLVKIMCNEKDYPNLTKQDFEHIEGIVAYLDYIQDTAVDKYEVPEEQVFYPADTTDADEDNALA